MAGYQTASEKSVACRSSVPVPQRKLKLKIEPRPSSSQILDLDLSRHRVLFARLQHDGAGVDVGGLDAEKFRPLVAEVGHSSGELGPGIPDDGVVGVLLADVDAAFERWVG